MRLFSDGPRHETIAALEKQGTMENTPNKKYETSVPDVYANDVMKVGNVELPVFDVENSEFYQNMTHNRKRLRFSGDAGKFMQNTNYRQPFYVRTTDPQTQKMYTRKVK